MTDDIIVWLDVDCSGYLYDYEGGPDTPPRRSVLQFDGEYADELSTAEIRQRLLDDGQLEDDDPMAVSDEALNAWLDEPAHLDEVPPSIADHIGPYSLGVEMYEELDQDLLETLGIHKVEGERPGDDFCGVRVDATPRAFNVMMEQRGYRYRMVEGGEAQN